MSYDKAYLVLEGIYYCLCPNHTLQLTTHRTSVRESLQPHCKEMMFLTKAGHYICKIMVVVAYQQVWVTQLFSGYYDCKMLVR